MYLPIYLKTTLLCLVGFTATAKTATETDSTKTKNPEVSVDTARTHQSQIITINSVKNNDLPISLLVDTTKKVTTEIKKQWFETFSIRGYMQVRYNRLLKTNSLLKIPTRRLYNLELYD